MAAMRHSRIELTMNLYTDPVLLDVAGAVEALHVQAGKQDPLQEGEWGLASTPDGRNA
ncbi:MAG TPA: hypothetical protein VM389_12310 [Phycisphaerae bacterium]|nr:hypothetical protein [Phycisphaerae bacterium]